MNWNLFACIVSIFTERCLHLIFLVFMYQIVKEPKVSYYFLLLLTFRYIILLVSFFVTCFFIAFGGFC